MTLSTAAVANMTPHATSAGEMQPPNSYDVAIRGSRPVSDRMTLVHNRGEPPHFVCRCGARANAIEDFYLCQAEPEYLPGQLLDPCACPKCCFCNRLLDADGRCENIDCKYVGLHILVPSGTSR